MSEARLLRLPARNSQLEVRGGGGGGPWWFHRGECGGKGKGERVSRRLACSRNRNWILLYKKGPNLY